MIKGSKHTAKTRAKMSASSKGCIAWNSGLTKETDSRVASYGLAISKSKSWGNGVRAMADARRDNAPWNKGLTKESDERVRRYSENGRMAKRGKIPWNKGMKMSAEHCAALERGKAAAYARGDYVKFSSPTSLEQALSLLLQSADLEFEAQKQFGRYTVDAWVSSHQLVFEADGEYWHAKLSARQIATRDAALLQQGVVAVIHLTGDDLFSWRPR